MSHALRIIRRNNPVNVRITSSGRRTSLVRAFAEAVHARGGNMYPLFLLHTPPERNALNHTPMIPNHAFFHRLHAHL